jgi:hypothetical protein
MCTNLDTGARAVPFLPHESMCTSPVYIVLLGQNYIMSSNDCSVILGLLKLQAVCLPLWQSGYYVNV